MENLGTRILLLLLVEKKVNNLLFLTVQKIYLISSREKFRFQGLVD